MPDPEPATGGEPAQSSTSIDAAELAAWLRRGESFTVLDVRNREEFQEWHITGPSVEAVQTPHQQFIAARVQETSEELVPDGPEPIIAVCGVGEASAEVAEQLRDGDTDARNLAGGMKAWAEAYESVELTCTAGTVRQYRRPATGCLSYLVVGDAAPVEPSDGTDAAPVEPSDGTDAAPVEPSDGTDAAPPQTADGTDARPAAVIDPLGAFADRYVADAAEMGAALRYAVDTHVHADHVSGACAVADETGAKLAVPADVTDNGLDYEATEPRFIEHGEQLSLGDAVLDALALPGHTSEMTGFRLRDDEQGDVLFGGDTLFLTSVARPDLAVEGENAVAEMAQTLHGTLADVAALPKDTRLAPGHVAEPMSADDGGRYVSTVGELRGRLDLLSLEESAFVDRVADSLPERPANDQTIREINLGKTGVDAETAFELELGPNNCAAE